MRSVDIQHIGHLDDLEVTRMEFAHHRFVAHCHRTFVIQRVHTGADWCEVNQQAAGPGDVWVHLPDAAHSGGTVASRGLGYTAIYPTSRLAADLVGIDPSDVPGGASFVLRDHACGRLLTRFFAGDRSASSAAEIVREIILHVLDHADRAPVAEHRRNHVLAKSSVEGVAQHLHRHCHRNVPTAELSAVFGLSPSHLIRQFKLVTGMTPRQFLISRRVAAAKELLDQGRSILDAALTAGFTDQSHLNRWFKRVTGYSPGAYVR